MEARIRRNIIILVVVTFLILVALSAGWYFVLVRPQNDEIKTTTEAYAGLKQKADGRQAALLKQRLAKDRLEYLKGQMFFFRGSDENPAGSGLYRRLYFGAIDGNAPINQRDREEVWRRWMNEYHYAYGPELRRELQRIAADAPSGQAPVVLKLPDIKVDDPPQKPEDVKAPPNGFLKPLSTTNNGALQLEVSGSFDSILRFLERLNRSSFLMVVGTIKLDGYQPTMKATFPVTPYLLAAGQGAKLSAAAAAPAGGAAPEDRAGGAPPSEAPPAGEGEAKSAEGATVKIKNPRNRT